MVPRSVSNCPWSGRHLHRPQRNRVKAGYEVIYAGLLGSLKLAPEVIVSEQKLNEDPPNL